MFVGWVGCPHHRKCCQDLPSHSSWLPCWFLMKSWPWDSATKQGWSRRGQLTIKDRLNVQRPVKGKKNNETTPMEPIVHLRSKYAKDRSCTFKLQDLNCWLREPKIYDRCQPNYSSKQRESILHERCGWGLHDQRPIGSPPVVQRGVNERQMDSRSSWKHSLVFVRRFSLKAMNLVTWFCYSILNDRDQTTSSAKDDDHIPV